MPNTDLSWLNLFHIILMLGTCYMCHYWGKIAGVQATVNLFIEKDLIKEEDLDKLQD